MFFTVTLRQSKEVETPRDAFSNIIRGSEGKQSLNPPVEVKALKPERVSESKTCFSSETEALLCVQQPVGKRCF